MTYQEAVELRNDRIEAAKRMFRNLASAFDGFGPGLVQAMEDSIADSLTVIRTGRDFDVVSVRNGFDVPEHIDHTEFALR